MRAQKTEDLKYNNGEPARWIITFNDLMTLLLVFFVLLFTMGSIEARKLEVFKNGLQSGLGVLEEGKKVEVSVATRTDLHVPGSNQIEKEMAIDSSKIKESIEELKREEGIGAEVTEEGVVIRLEESVLFDSGIADINPDAFPVLERLAEIISDIPNPVRIEGHTDNIPIHTRKFPSNWELSTARAINVIKYLANIKGIAPERLAGAGYGEVRPLVSNDTPENRAINRRVEVILVTKGGKYNGK
jgi:chemotaxis protein MotB